MEQAVIEYLANALWQLPVLALGAWLLLRMWSPGPAARHRVWLAVLALGLLLPLRGVMGPATAEMPYSGMALRPASLSSVGGQTDSPEGTQNILGEESASARLSHHSNEGPFAHPVNQNLFTGTPAVGAPAYEGWGTRAFLAYLYRVSVNAAALNWSMGLWLAVALWGLARLAMAWHAARRLVANSQEAVLDERERAALLECARRIGVKVPEIRESDALAGPVVVGAARPVLLWPEGFANFPGDELRAALLHELAHVRRRDYGMNLLCEAAALPLKWHPVTHVVERQIRATREMACDAIAAEAMESETVYAECLVSLARSIAGGGLAESAAVAGLFNGNVMEERVMQLMRGKSAMNMRARVARGAAGAVAMIAAIALAGAFHVVPAMAQDAPVAPVAPSAVPSAPPTPAAPAFAAVPSARVVPAVPTAQVGTPPPPPPASEPAGAAPAVPPVPPNLPQTPAIAPPRIPAAPPVPATEPPEPPVPQTPAAVMPAPPPVPQTPAAVPPRAHREKPVVIRDGQERELTPAERARIEKQLAEAQERIAEATAKINSPEFRKQMEDAQAKALKAQTRLNSAEWKRERADAQKRVAAMMAKMNSPEFQKKIQAEIDASAKINSEEFRKAISDSQAAALRAQTMINSAEFQKHMADAQKQVAEPTARLNSPEFKRQIQEAVDASMKVNSAEFKKQMADAQKQIADAMAKMKAEQEKRSGHRVLGPGRKGPQTMGQGTGK